MENKHYFKWTYIALLVAQCTLLICLNFLSWHLKDDFLTYSIMIWFAILFASSHLIGVKKIVVLFVFLNMLVGIYYSYSPYTHWLISGLEILDTYSDDQKGSVFLLKFGNESVATVVFSKSNWTCHGKEYSTPSACRHISEVIQGRLKNK